MNKPLRLNSPLILLFILFTLTVPLQAATLTYGTGLVANNASGDSVLNDGVFVMGVNVGGTAAATINGVVFSAQPVASSSPNFNFMDNGVTLSASGSNGDDSYGGTPGYSNAGLDNMLDSGIFTNNVGDGSDNISFSFSGLTIGQFYRVQLFVYQQGSTGGGTGRNAVLSSDGQFSGVANPSNTEAAFITAIWQADATTQSFALTPEVTDPTVNRRATLDGVSLFVVPEPNSMALLGAASGLLFLRRRKRSS